MTKYFIIKVKDLKEHQYNSIMNKILITKIIDLKKDIHKNISQ